MNINAKINMGDKVVVHHPINFSQKINNIVESFLHLDGVGKTVKVSQVSDNLTFKEIPTTTIKAQNVAMNMMKVICYGVFLPLTLVALAYREISRHPIKKTLEKVQKTAQPQIDKKEAKIGETPLKGTVIDHTKQPSNVSSQSINKTSSKAGISFSNYSLRILNQKFDICNLEQQEDMLKFLHAHIDNFHEDLEVCSDQDCRSIFENDFDILNEYSRIVKKEYFVYLIPKKVSITPGNIIYQNGVRDEIISEEKDIVTGKRFYPDGTELCGTFEKYALRFIEGTIVRNGVTTYALCTKSVSSNLVKGNIAQIAINGKFETKVVDLIPHCDDETPHIRVNKWKISEMSFVDALIQLNRVLRQLSGNYLNRILDHMETAEKANVIQSFFAVPPNLNGNKVENLTPENLLGTLIAESQNRTYVKPLFYDLSPSCFLALLEQAKKENIAIDYQAKYYDLKNVPSIQITLEKYIQDITEAKMYLESNGIRELGNQNTVTRLGFGRFLR